MSESDLDDATRTLTESAREMGVKVDDRQVTQLRAYCALVLDANQRFNLTAMKTAADVMRTLVLDSLTLVPALPANLTSPQASVRVVDVGTGAGVPGIPLKILFPHWSMLLVDSVEKKARFVQEVVKSLELVEVEVVSLRAEEVGSMPAYRDAADLCLARAVAALPSLVELCAPLVKAGGLLAFPKGGDVQPEVASAMGAAHALKVRLQEVYAVPSKLGGGENRHIILYEKVGATPAGYPRRIGLATSRPIEGRADSEPPPTRDQQSPAGSTRRRPPGSR